MTALEGSSLGAKEGADCKEKKEFGHTPKPRHCKGGEAYQGDPGKQEKFGGKNLDRSAEGRPKGKKRICDAVRSGLGLVLSWESSLSSLFWGVGN